MTTITVKELIEKLQKCDPEALVVGYIEHKEYELPIEVVEQFTAEQIFDRAREDSVDEDEEIYPSSPYYTKSFSAVEDHWSKEGKIPSVVYLREKWYNDNDENPTMIYMRKDVE